jgi:hypothetical protein
MSEMNSHEIALLEFLGGGSSLSAAEKQEAAHANEIGMRTVPQKWREADARGAKLLQQMPTADPGSLGDYRQSSRLLYENGKALQRDFQPMFDIEARIVKAHDPTVYFDKASGILVTEQTLRALEKASTWTAQQFQIPGPDSDFLKNVREGMRANFSANFDKIGVEGLVHMERDYPYGAAFFRQIGPQRTAAFFNAQRPHMIDLPDKKSSQLNLAKSACVIAKVGFENVVKNRSMQSTMATSLFMQKMTQRQMQQNVWSLAHPECAPAGSHPSSCITEAPISQPISPF